MSKFYICVAFINGSFSLSGKFWLDIGGPICNLPNQQDADFVTESIMETLAYLETGMRVDSI